jgi:hypothetical protein
VRCAKCGLSSQNFRQCRSTATQNYSPLSVRHSLFAAVLFPTCRFADLTTCRQLGSAGISPSHFSRPSSRVPRPVLSRRPVSLSSTKCGLKIRSMTCFRLRHQHGLKFAAWFVLGCDIASELGNPQQGFCQLGSVAGTI